MLKGFYLLPLQFFSLPDKLQQQAGSLQVVTEAVPLFQLLLQCLVRLHMVLQETQASAQ